MIHQCMRKLLFKAMEDVLVHVAPRYCIVLKKTSEKIKYCEGRSKSECDHRSYCTGAEQEAYLHCNLCCCESSVMQDPKIQGGNLG